MNGIYGYKDLKIGYVVYIGKDSYIDHNKRHNFHVCESNKNKQHCEKHQYDISKLEGVE